VERLWRSLGRVSAAAAKAAAESIIMNAVRMFDERHLRVMIRNDWYLIESLRWNLRNLRRYDRHPGAPRELAEEFERRKAYFVKMGLAALGFMKQLAGFFPRQLVEKYLSVDYALKYYREKAPWVVRVVEEEPNGRRWLENQIEEIKAFLYGPGQYSYRFGAAPPLQQAGGGGGGLRPPRRERASQR